MFREWRRPKASDLNHQCTKSCVLKTKPGYVADLLDQQATVQLFTILQNITEHKLGQNQWNGTDINITISQDFSYGTLIKQNFVRS